MQLNASEISDLIKKEGEYRNLWKLQKLHSLFCRDLFAVTAAEFQILFLFVDDSEKCRHLFIVGDAVGIETFNDLFYFIRD